MRHRSSIFWDIFSSLLLLVIGLALIYGNLVDRDFGSQILIYLQIPIIGMIVGLIMTISVIMRWVSGVGRRTDGFIDFELEQGSVGISTKAIKDFAEQTAKEFSAVKNVDTKLIRNRGQLDIVLRVKVESGNPIPELSQVIQQRIRENMSESLGIDQINKVIIHISEIIGDVKDISDNADALN